jgi:tRNA-modifying protein YgfZ
VNSVSDATAELVVLDGGDAASYLDSQCTQDLGDLQVDHEAWTFVLAPAGEIVAFAIARRPSAERLELEVPAGTGASLVARLRRFAIRSDVTVHDATSFVGDGVLASERDRIEATVPGPSELARALVPHGVSRELLERCVSFTKGCYPGQELVARLQSRGATPPYVLRGLVADVPLAVGDAVGEARFDGAVTSVSLDDDGTGCLALCVLHRRDTEAATAEVRTAAAPVVVRLR